MIKKSASKPKLAGGVNKDPLLRVSVPMVIDVAPVKKKKKSASNGIVAPVPKVKKISLLSKEGRESIFGRGAEKIQQLLEVNETDSAVALIYKRALQAVVDLIPLAENTVRKSDGAKGVYQVNALLSSLRELLVDVQSAQDRGMMGTALMEQVVKPAFSDMAQDVLHEYSILAQDAKNGMTEKEWARFSLTIKESRARLADKMTRNYRRVNEETVNYLQR